MLKKDFSKIGRTDEEIYKFAGKLMFDNENCYKTMYGFTASVKTVELSEDDIKDLISGKAIVLDINQNQVIAIRTKE